MIDIHAHILPAIDDGPKTIEESIEICKVAANDGIKKIVATPHSKLKEWSIRDKKCRDN